MKYVKFYFTEKDLENMVRPKLPEEYRDHKVSLKYINQNTLDFSTELTCLIYKDDDNTEEDKTACRRLKLF